jgi:S1-C subfamily serine protease
MSDVTTSSQLGQLGQFSDELATLVERVSASTVSIHPRTMRPGTATIVAADLVVAADHSIERDDDLSVHTGDGRTLTATLVGRDPSTDLALLRVEGLNGTPLAPAAAAPRVGALAVAVTRSWQARTTARLGIVAGVNSSIRFGRGARLENVIVPDIGLARGLSGSPLVSAHGELLGILTTAIVRGVPIAIPTDTLTQVIGTLVEHGRVRRGYLGVALQTVRLTDRQRAVRDQKRGALIVGLSGGGPADAAGLLIGDIFVGAAGSRVGEIDDVQQALQSTAIGGTLAVEVLRGGTLVTVDVTVGEPPQ